MPRSAPGTVTAMRWLPHRLPAAVREQRRRGERILAYGQARDGAPVVATDKALVLTDGTRLPWERIDHATWDDPELRIIATDSEHTIELTEPRRLPEVVYDRVTSTIVVTRHIPLDGELGVRVIARRAPGSSQLEWRLRFDAGLDPEDTRLRARADQIAAELRDLYI